MIPESHKIRQLMVYCVTNTVNGKIYIGKTRQTIRRRWNHHVHQANTGCSRNLCKAIRKYGEAAFMVDILGVYQTLEDLNQAEIKFIADLRAIEPKVGYNMTTGGEGDIFINNPYVENIKVKLKGRVCSEGTKEKIRKANKGRKFGPRPPEWGESIRKGKAAKVAVGYVYKRNPNIPGNNKGKKASAETRAKISAGLKLAIRKPYQTTNTTGTKVHQRTLAKVEKVILESCIKQGMSFDALCKLFCVSSPTLYQILKIYWSKTLIPLRIEWGLSDPYCQGVRHTDNKGRFLPRDSETNQKAKKP